MPIAPGAFFAPDHCPTLQTEKTRGYQDDQAGLRIDMMAVEEEEGEGEVAALLHNYLNMVEVRHDISLVGTGYQCNDQAKRLLKRAFIR